MSREMTEAELVCIEYAVVYGTRSTESELACPSEPAGLLLCAPQGDPAAPLMIFFIHHFLLTRNHVTVC